MLVKEARPEIGYTLDEVIVDRSDDLVYLKNISEYLESTDTEGSCFFTIYLCGEVVARW